MMDKKVEKQHQVKNTHSPKHAASRAVSEKEFDRMLKSLNTEHWKLDKKISSKRSAIKKIEDENNLQQQKIGFLQSIEILDDNNDDALQKEEKNRVKAHAILEKGVKAKQNNAMMEKLNEEEMALISEMSQVEEILNKYKWYGHVLFKLSLPEWQEAQTETMKTQDAQENQNSNSEKTAVNKGVERNLESGPDGALPSATEPNLSASSKGTLNLASGRAIEEEKLELNFSDPSEIVVEMSELKDRILFLKQNSTKEDIGLKKVSEITRAKIKEKEQMLTLQVNDMEERIQKEKDKAGLFKIKVQLHHTLKTNDQDNMLEVLAKKVTHVHSCCVGRGLAKLKTLDKLSAIEGHLYSVLEGIASIPEEDFKRLCLIEERREKSRLEQERLQLEKEKKRVMMERCRKRCLAEGKKSTGRKLMTRCMHVKHKTQANEESDSPKDEELHHWLFSEDDD